MTVPNCPEERSIQCLIDLVFLSHFSGINLILINPNDTEALATYPITVVSLTKGHI